MKRLCAFLITLLIILSLCACGRNDSSEDSSEAVKEDISDTQDTPQEIEPADTPTASTVYSKRTVLTGSWVCSGLISNGKEYGPESVEEVLGQSPESALCFELLEDNRAVFATDAEVMPMMWEEGENGEIILTMNPQDYGLDGTNTVSITLTPSDNGALCLTDEAGTQILASPVDTRPELLNGYPQFYFRPDYNQNDTYALSNYMAEGNFLLYDGTLYGRIYKEGKIAFGALGLDTSGDEAVITSAKVLCEQTFAYYINIVGDKLYYLAIDYSDTSSRSIVCSNLDGSGRRVITDEAWFYFSVRNGRLWFCDAENRYWSTDLEGSDKTLILDKEVFFPYCIDSEWLLYQDDADDESLHIYNLNTHADSRLVYNQVYTYGITGNTMYFAHVPSWDSGESNIARMDFTKPVSFYSDSVGIVSLYQMQDAQNEIYDQIFVTDSYIFAPNNHSVDVFHWDTLVADSDKKINYKVMYFDNLCYIVYNSNNSGGAKGVIIHLLSTDLPTEYLQYEKLNID